MEIAKSNGKGTLAMTSSPSKSSKKTAPTKKAKKAIQNTAAKGDSKVNEMAGFDFNFEQEQANDIPETMDGDISANDFKGVKFRDVDINKNKSNNIFKVITTRYFKTAYPVLVEEIK